MNTLQILILGLLLGGVYSLMASGLTLVYGVMRIINLAHAAFMLIAAYGSYFLVTRAEIDPILSIVVIMPTMFGFGVVLYRVLFPRIEGSPRYSEHTVLLTFGLALIIEGLLGYRFTNIFRSTDPSYATATFKVGELFVPTGQLLAAATSAVLLVGLALVLGRTRTGRAIRALSQNRNAARTVGINVLHVSSIAFGLGMALAGAAGSLMSYLFTFFPGMHWQWIALLLSLIVLGGMGSLKGAVIASLTLAVAAAFVSDTFGSVWSPMTFYLSLFVILLVRPQGLFGSREAM